jgi:ABC-2 type transport system ATP-binding protein
MNKILEISGLNKTIKGNHILKDIDVTFESGQIYGIVGKNGSGKTMLIKTIAGLVVPNSGQIIYDGKILHKDVSYWDSIGLVIETGGLYTDFSGQKNLMLLANIQKKIGKSEVVDAITRVGLDPSDKRPFRKYSLGMKQRIAIAQAIMETPDILLLDEPTNALDADGVDAIRKIVLEEKERGALVLIASHIKEDIDILADETFRIAEGALSRI